MGSPVSPIVADLYTEEVETGPLSSSKGTTPNQVFPYEDDTWVTIKTQEVEAFTEHLSSVDSNIKFKTEDMKENTLPLLDCPKHFEKDIEVPQKPSHTDHHPLEAKVGVIRTLHHQAETVPTRTEGKSEAHKHIKTALKTCGNPNQVYVKSTKSSRSNTRPDNTGGGEEQIPQRCHSLCGKGISEILKNFL